MIFLSVESCSEGALILEEGMDPIKDTKSMNIRARLDTGMEHARRDGRVPARGLVKTNKRERFAPKMA